MRNWVHFSGKPRFAEAVDKFTNPAHWMPRLIAALFVFAAGARGEVWISEVVLNPPGSDAPNQYIEFRGTPNLILPNGTYFVAVEGDMNGDPGTIQNVFDLSGVALGGNGFSGRPGSLPLLTERSLSYTPLGNRYE